METLEVTLALQLAVAANGAPFPGRDLLVFLCASTILLTLIVNGLTLPLFIRFLGVHGDGAAEREERADLLVMRDAGIINDETMRAIEVEIDDSGTSLSPRAAREHA